jgi:hypothetical protein
MLCVQYIRHLHAQAKQEASAQDSWHQPYNDYLQAPLQVLEWAMLCYAML